MKTKIKKFWKKLFNELEKGDRVKLVGKNPVLQNWIDVGRNGKITLISRDLFGTYYLVCFKKKDNPSMTEEEDYASFRRDDLELF